MLSNPRSSPLICVLGIAKPHEPSNAMLAKVVGFCIVPVVDVITSLLVVVRLPSLGPSIVRV